MVLWPASTPPIISPKPTPSQTWDQEPLSVLTMNPWKEKLGILKHFGPNSSWPQQGNKLPHTNIKIPIQIPKDTEIPSFAASSSRRRAPLIHPPPIHPLTFTQRKKSDIYHGTQYRWTYILLAIRSWWLKTKILGKTPWILCYLDYTNIRQHLLIVLVLVIIKHFKFLLQTMGH